MAKLYSSLNTSRNRRWGEQVHRLGDTWVEATVQNWNHQLVIWLNDEGKCQIGVRDLQKGGACIAYNGPLEDLFRALASGGPLLPAPEKKPTRRGHKKSALDREVEQFLKESA